MTLALLGLLAGLAGPARAQGDEEAARREPAPTVLAIVVEGARRYTDEQLVRALGQGLGEPLDQFAINRGIDNLYRSLRVRSAVYVRRVEGGVELRLEVVELPADRDPRFVGNNKVKTDDLREWALLEDREELYLHEAPRVRQRILDGYRREGFYWAEVDVLTRGGAEEGVVPDVIFEIREGPRVRVSDVIVRGNDSMPDRGMLLWRRGLSHLARRSLGGPGVLNWFGDRFVEEELQADLVAMRQVYRDRGYLDAVVEVERLDFNEERDRVVIHIVVDEGEPYRVARVGVQAVEWGPRREDGTPSFEPAELLFPEEELVELLELHEGDLFSASGRASDERALLDYYGERGFVDHFSLPRAMRFQIVDPLLIYDVENRTVDVTYRVVQGRELRIREIRFAGTEHTLDRVLRRELSVFPGGPADMVEIRRSLARIQGTGYFSDPSNPIDHPDPTFRFVEVEGLDSEVDIEFLVEEGRVVDFNVSGGFDTNNGLFALLSVSMRNFDVSRMPSGILAMPGEVYRKEAFHGAGQRLDIEVSPGTQVNRFRIRFQEPDVFRRHLDPIGFDVDLYAREQIFSSHDERRRALVLRLSRRFGRNTSIFGGVQIGDVRVSNLDSTITNQLINFGAPRQPPPGPQSLVDQEADGTQALNGLLGDFVYRELDNLLTPRNGIRFRSNNAFYTDALGSGYEFFSTVNQFDLYTSVRQDRRGLDQVLHFEVDFGVAEPFGSTDVVPYSERFFLGGVRSMRGFEFRGVGPVDPITEFAEGGESTLNGTLEYVIPLLSQTQRRTFQEVETLRGVLFLDYGILDPNGGFPDVDELRVSAGFGIGLAAPLPLTLNFGFPLRDQDGDQLQVFSFGLSIN